RPSSGRCAQCRNRQAQRDRGGGSADAPRHAGRRSGRGAVAADPLRQSTIALRPLGGFQLRRFAGAVLGLPADRHLGQLLQHLVEFVPAGGEGIGHLGRDGRLVVALDQAVAEAVAAGAQAVAGIKASLIPVGEAEGREAELDAADAIIFGSPTYMGGVSADFAKFKDWTSKKWMARNWQDKLAAGFTVSASWGGDKQNTIYQLLTLAQQHGMIW